MEKFQTITREELKQKIDAGGDFALIDVLTEMSYSQRHLPGAINIPMHGEGFEKKVAQAVPNKDMEVIVYCSSFSCQASPTAAGKLVDLGYTNVKDFKGGLADWEDAGYSFE